MYTLYYLPSACSLATQVVLRELGQDFDLIDVQKLEDFSSLNPLGSVPVLSDGERNLKEGAAIILHLLDKHENRFLPNNDAEARQQAIQDIMFANATLHSAYGRLFFAARAMDDADTKQRFFDAVAADISKLWAVVEDQLQTKHFLGGDHASVADIMLAVYSRWGAAFPVTIEIGERTTKMIEAVLSMPSFQQSLQAEEQNSAAA